MWQQAQNVEDLCDNNWKYKRQLENLEGFCIEIWSKIDISEEKFLKSYFVIDRQNFEEIAKTAC